MSLKRRAELLAGHDAATLLEAASTVLADIEMGRFDAVAARLRLNDQRALAAWIQRTRAESVPVAPTPVHPLSVLAATTLALGQSGGGPRSDEVREELAKRVTEVGIRFNDDVLEGPSSGDDAIAAYMSRSALWRAVEQEDWMFWSGDLVAEMMAMPEAQDLLTRFRVATGLTIEEWWLRGLAERATREIHGARSWGGAKVDPRIDQAWARLAVAPLEQAVAKARAALTQTKRGDQVITDPFDLHWLATRPVVETPDSRRFHLWLGSITRSLLPAAIAQTIADTLGDRYDNVAELLGHAAEHLLTAAIEAVPNVDSDPRFRESAMPVGKSKRCDYLIEHGDVLFGVDFTLLSPTRDLSRGTTEAVEKLIGRVEAKFAQVYSSMRWRDPTQIKRWLPMVVFASPTAINDPLLNERVHKRLIADGHLASGPSELMTCGAPEFLDFLHYAQTHARCPVELILDWRDGPQAGTMLDWWLADRNALRGSAKARIDRITNRVAEVLAPP